MKERRRELLGRLAEESFILSEAIKDYLAYEHEDNCKKVFAKIGSVETLIQILDQNRASGAASL